MTSPESEPLEYRLVPPNNPILRQKIEKFSFSNPPINPVELYNILGQRMVDLGGIGLSANQLGFPYNCFVIRSDPILGMFNARIVDVSDETIELEEGCLSFPGIIVKVHRPRVIRVR
jgi:peptide deformylase